MPGAGGWRVDLGGSGAITAVLDAAGSAGSRDLFVCAHGAGGHRDDGSMIAARDALVRHGFDVVRFNFPYREHGSRRPDAMPVLMRTVAAVADSVATEIGPRRLILGGRSMGGRAASMLRAEGGIACEGLLLLAYPLHPAGQPNKRRDAHLARIGVPVLCVNGTRDALCRQDLMDATVASLPHWTMHWLAGADHSFHVLKRSGRTDAEVIDEAAAAARAWADRLPRR
jgi:hypothetical protein